jgi:superfamily II DNA or RNA helicase
VAYVTKNSAPRETYLKKLSKLRLKEELNIKTLFRSPFRLSDSPANFYDCLIVDEAHRLVKQMYMDYN